MLFCHYYVCGYIVFMGAHVCMGKWKLPHEWHKQEFRTTEAQELKSQGFQVGSRVLPAEATLILEARYERVQA